MSNNDAATSPRTGRDLLAATRPFASDDTVKSWYYVATTFFLIAATFVTAAMASWWPIQLVLGILAGLLMVRGFILYHDYAHGAILRKSPLARVVMHIYGMFVLSPISSWKGSHNAHHAETMRHDSDQPGSFPLMTVRAWKNASFGRRLGYRMMRNPIIIIFAYLCVFFWDLTFDRFRSNPSRHFDCGVALLIHAAFITLIWVFLGFWPMFFVVLVPFFVASMLGAYLFYAQHNFPGIKILDDDEWNHVDAALESSSYMKMNPIMDWFTGNIGYHHIHHLNLAIPFYRLPEVMEAVPELRECAKVTTLSPKDILACMRLKLWDEKNQEMLSFRDVKLGRRARYLALPLRRRA